MNEKCGNRLEMVRNKVYFACTLTAGHDGDHICEEYGKEEEHEWSQVLGRWLTEDERQDRPGRKYSLKVAWAQEAS